MIKRRALLPSFALSTLAAQPSIRKPVSNLYHFLGGPKGSWKVARMSAFRGEGMSAIERLDVVNGELTSPPTGTVWALRGFTSNVRYATRAEVTRLKANQPPLGRPEATCAALIPIRKTAAWWDLPQDERRQIFETTSHHTAIGLDYLPAIARRLHHSRDLGGPFDFLTWFEFAPQHQPAFDELLHRLRATPEWTFVDREIDIRLVKD